MFRRIAFSLLVLAIAAPAFAEDRAPTPLRVYFVGNSVTDTINYRALAELAKSRGYTQVWGRHMIPEVQNVLERLHALADARDEAIVRQVRGNEAAWNSATSEQKAALMQDALLPVSKDP